MTPAPMIRRSPPWSPDLCSWADQVLVLDAKLDLAEADAVASGSDTRYGTGQWLVDYYRAYGQEWTAVDAEVTAACATPSTLPTPAQRADALAWFSKAIAAHQADTAARPDDADWNNQWVSNYTHLTTMFEGLPS
jgi:hypothetical protein